MAGYRKLERDGNTPAYPFGFGLSYTSYRHANLTLTQNQFNPSEILQVSLDVSNTGASPSEEVVQLYICYRDATVPRPLKELKGFKRITLQPGECKTMTFTLHTHQLGYYDEAVRYAVHPGKVEVMVGNSSDHLPLTGTFEITGQAVDISDEKVFFGDANLE